MLFSTGKTQDGVLFLTLVQQYRVADGPVRLIMASHIMRDYFEVTSPRYLDGIISSKRVRLMHQVREHKFYHTPKRRERNVCALS